MKPNYIFSAVAIAIVGLAGVWGANEYLLLKSQLEEVQSTAQTVPQAAPSPPVVPVPSPAPSSLSLPVQIDFDKLPLCDQLDGLAKSGKSVSQFIANSGRYDEFETQVTANCDWNAEQLKLADRILHPPVKKSVAQEPSSRRQSAEANEPPVLSSRVPTPRRIPWGNCNGLEEADESPDAKCGAIQKYNDEHESHRKGDNRPPWRQLGKNSYRHCYSSSGECLE
jgi:hypothetical protein